MEKQDRINDRVEGLNHGYKFNKSEVTWKNVVHILYILITIAVSYFFMPLLKPYINTFIYPVISMYALGASAVTSLIENRREKLATKKSHNEMKQHLYNVEKNGIKVSKDATKKRMDKIEELKYDYDIVTDKELYASIISKAGLVLEGVGAVLPYILPKGFVAVTFIGLLTNIIAKIVKGEYHEQAAELDRRITNLNNDLDLSVLYVKYQDDKKENEKVKQHEYKLREEKTYDKEKEKLVDEYLENEVKPRYSYEQPKELKKKV